MGRNPLNNTARQRTGDRGGHGISGYRFGLRNYRVPLAVAASSNPLSASNGTCLFVFPRRYRLGRVGLGWLGPDGYKKLVVSLDPSPRTDSVVDDRESTLG